LKEAFDIRMLLVTRGAKGAILSDAVNFYECEGFKVIVADTIGSGDSFLAGFLKKYLEGKPMGEALTYACAVGALVATCRGAIPAVSEEEIWKIMNG
jgi:fructokinase